MSAADTSLVSLIGERVRARRHARGWTLDELAERSGVSRRMLVNIEQGVTNASIATLLRLSEALGLGLPSLVAPSDGETPGEGNPGPGPGAGWTTPPSWSARAVARAARATRRPTAGCARPKPRLPGGWPDPRPRSGRTSRSGAKRSGRSGPRRRGRKAAPG